MRLLLLLLVAACGTAPKENFYTLSSPAPVEAAAPAALAIVVGPVTVPESVDRNPMVIRTGPNTVEVDDLHRWAEPLKAAIPRVVAANLARELGARVTTGRQATGAAADYRVAIDVSRFESSLAEGAMIEAAWVVSGKSGAPASGRSVLREAASPGDHAGIAGAHSRALERLAKEIAAAISPRSSTPPRPAPGR
jgi:uncharacterized lipoprotein YmbA